MSNTRKKTLRITLRIIETVLEALQRREIKQSNSFLAEKLGTSRPYISRMFKGEGNFTIQTLVKLLDAAGLEVEMNFYSKDTLEPFNYISVGTVDLKKHKPVYKGIGNDYGLFMQKLKEKTNTRISSLPAESIGNTSFLSTHYSSGQSAKYNPVEYAEELV